MDKEKIIEHIINMEWSMFQKVDNIGGRAACQDDRETFYIMRYSQYFNWTEDMLELYEKHLLASEHQGRNLISEKYGRMMEFTEPEYYQARIAPKIQPLSRKMGQAIDDILDILIPWEKEFCLKYPKLALTGRPISENPDEQGFTSMETYARGELSTYPEELLGLYLEFVSRLKGEGKSISLLDRDIMVKLYGYDSIEAAEESLI